MTWRKSTTRRRHRVRMGGTGNSEPTYETYRNKTGYSVVQWMVENNVWPKTIILHTMNPAGRQHMKSAIERHAPEHVELEIRVGGEPMTQPITIDMGWMFAGLDEERARRDGDLIGRNRKLWEQGRIPTGPEDVRAGDVIMPLEGYWMRGPGVVDRVDQNDEVWATYGPREGASAAEMDSVRVCSRWHSVVVLQEARG